MQKCLSLQPCVARAFFLSSFALSYSGLFAFIIFRCASVFLMRERKKERVQTLVGVEMGRTWEEKP